MAVTFAQIEPTTRCNFTCGFCVGRHMPQGDLDWADFQAFLEAYPALEHVELQGEGEPMLHPRFFDMVDACRARAIKVSIITNGSLLTPERVERLIESGVATVHVSLETTDPDQFRSIRGGLFAKVEAGVELLMERRARLGRRTPRVGLAVTLLRDTLGGFPAIRALYARLGLDAGISVQPLQRMADYAGVYDPVMAEQVLPAAAAPRLRSIRASALQAEPTGTDSFYAALFAGFDPRRSCPWLERGAYLGIGGAVAPCCFIKRPDHSFGNLRAQGAQSIAQHRAAANAELLSGRIPKSCAGCGTAAAVAASAQPRALSVFSLTPPALR